MNLIYFNYQFYYKVIFELVATFKLEIKLNHTRFIKEI